MDDATIYVRLTEIFESVFDDDEIVVTSDLSAEDVEEWDSLTHIRLVLTIEKPSISSFQRRRLGNWQTSEIWYG